MITAIALLFAVACFCAVFLWAALRMAARR